jgi:lysophospholipase L1-like esterase
MSDSKPAIHCEARVKQPFRPLRMTCFHQQVFPFLDRSRRRRRQFKLAISITTCLIMSGLIVAFPSGREFLSALNSQLRHLAIRDMGLPPAREDIDRDWRRFRLQEIEKTSRGFHRDFGEYDPALRRLMKYAGSDPETGLLRWGNVNMTLLLPSKVFLPDDTGRSYRFRPDNRAIWVQNLKLKKGPPTFFLVPHGRGLDAAIEGTGGIVVDGSLQTTNSWGLRGPEPDFHAALRGIVLGDSFMQGMLIDDKHTPPECLRNFLQSRLKTSVSILNTGHVGYSPEQYYFTLLEYTQKFQPHFVVVSVCANDFVGLDDVFKEGGDWDEAKYWLDEIRQYARSKGMVHLVVPAPLERQIGAPRMAGYYQGRVSNILRSIGMEYRDPLEEFIDEHIFGIIQGERAEKRPTSSPLFNGVIGDGHFSALGSQVWAEAIGRRLALLLEAARQAERLKF